MTDRFDSPDGATQFDWEEVAKAVQVERDRLRQQVERLTLAAQSAIEAGRALAAHTQGFSEKRAVAEAKEQLDAAADQVRKELE